MNGIEKISAHIEAEAMAEIAAMEAETSARCSEILARAEMKAAEAYEKLMEKGRADCAVRRERLGAAADMEQRKAALAFKQKLLGEAFRKAEEAILNLSPDEYTEFLALQASKAAMSGCEELSFNDKDRTLAGSVCKKANSILKAQGRVGRLTVASDTVDIPGGLILRSGNIEVNCAVDTLITIHRSRLSAPVASILFD